MKKQIAKILDDDSALEQYINELNEQLEQDDMVEKRIDDIIAVLLSEEKFNNFKNAKYLRSTYIDSVANLLKLKTELPLKKAQTQKILVDILSKKKDLDYKEKALKSNEENSKTITESLRSLFAYLDNNDIHPTITDNLIEDSSSIVDTGNDEIENEVSE